MVDGVAEVGGCEVWQHNVRAMVGAERRVGMLSHAFSQARFCREEKSPHILLTLCRLNIRARDLNFSFSSSS